MFRCLQFTIAAVLVLASTVALAADPVTLAPKFPSGETVQTEADVKFDQVLGLGGQDLNSKVAVTVVTKQAFGEASDDGSHPVNMTFGSISAEMTLPGGQELKFDTADEEIETEGDIAALVGEIFRKQAALDVKYTIDAGGQVGPIEGDLEGTQIDRNNFRKELQQVIDMLPDEPVKEGDEWDRTESIDVGNGQLLTFQRRYKYLGTTPEFPTLADSRQLDKIGVTDLAVVYEIDPNGGLPITVEKSDLKIDSSKGTVLFDRDSGRIVSSVHDTRIKGDLELAVAGMELDGTLDLTMSLKSKELAE